MQLFHNFIINPGKTAKLTAYKLLCTFGSQDFRRFIVLSRARTGSNLLISFLSNHPNIHAEGEIFVRLKGRKYKDVFSKIFSKKPYYIKAAGFKIFYYHPVDDQTKDIWEELADLDNLWIIHLKRRNILRTLISRKLAGFTGVWRVGSPIQHYNSTNRKNTFTVEELEKGFEETMAWELHGDEMFRNKPLISVYYEDLVSKPECKFNQITDFLGVSRLKPKSKLEKQNPEKLRDLVGNYDELKAAFYRTKWGSFFEE